MKDIFDDFNKQGRYILRLINDNTDLEKICQFCGKPGNLKNNRQFPYEIQFVCPKCKKDFEINPITEMYDEIPLINIKEHLTGERLGQKFIKITDEQVDKMSHILKGGFTKSSAARYMGVTQSYYKKIIKAYEEKFNIHIEEKLKRLYKEAFTNRLIDETLSRTVNNIYNNISKIKNERGISNIMIYEKTGIRPCTISYICNGKTIPKNTTMTTLADVLNCTVTDLFPEYNEFSTVHDISTLRYRMMKTYTQIIFLWTQSKEKKFTKFLIKLSSDLDISFETLRTFLISTKKDPSEINLDILQHNMVKLINDLFNTIEMKDFDNEKMEVFEEWKERMKPRKH